jgi:AbrB family looped-hinge helix DNA binding protein
MPSEVTRIGPKFQVTIPKGVRNQLGLKVGDLVQARVGDNHTIVMERKRLVDFDAELEDDLLAAEADYKAGRVLGPFANAKEAMRALTGTSARTPAAKTRMDARGRAVKSALHARTRHP